MFHATDNSGAQIAALEVVRAGPSAMIKTMPKRHIKEGSL